MAIMMSTIGKHGGAKMEARVKEVHTAGVRIS